MCGAEIPEQAIVNWFLSIFVSLLPERYRKPFGWGFVSSAGAVTSGLIELLACVITLLYRYVMFAGHRLGLMPEHVTLGAAEKGGETAIMGMGIFVTMEYAIQPLTLLLGYFAVEGLVRAGAGLVTKEVVPTLPLQLVSFLHGRASAAATERAMGPRVADEVRTDVKGCDLQIASCRPKLSWNKLMTISYADQLYEVASEEQGELPRRFVYRLTKKPESKVVRGLHMYDPEEALPEEERTKPPLINADERGSRE